MKKTALLILFVLAAMILGITAGASAESKGEYYEEIDDALCLVQDLLGRGDVEGMQEALGLLRGVVYRCARFLTVTGEYDARILNVISLATKATEMTSEEDQGWYFSRARIIASQVLLGRFPAELGCADGLCDDDHS